MIMTPYIKLHYKWVVLFSSILNSLHFEPPCSFLHDKRQSHLLILICMMWTNEIKSHSAMIKVQWQTNVFAQWRNKYEIVIQMYWKIMYIPMTYSWTKLLSTYQKAQMSYILIQLYRGRKEEIGKLCEYFTIHKILSNAIKRQEREGKFHLVEGKGCYRKTITGIARFYLGNFQLLR